MRRERPGREDKGGDRAADLADTAGVAGHGGSCEQGRRRRPYAIAEGAAARYNDSPAATVHTEDPARRRCSFHFDAALISQAGDSAAAGGSHRGALMNVRVLARRVVVLLLVSAVPAAGQTPAPSSAVPAIKEYLE